MALKKPLLSPLKSALRTPLGPDGITVVPVSLSILAGYTALYAVVKSVGYTGPCIRVVRASDSAELDIGFGADGFMDVAAATAFKGGSTLTVKTWYDQSVNGNHATQATVGNQPLINTDYPLQGFYGLFNGDIADIFAGTKRFFDLPAGVTFDTQAHTTLAMIAPLSSGNIHPVYQNGPDTGTAYTAAFNRNIAVRPGIYLKQTPGFPVIAPVPGPLYSGFTFIGTRGTATNKAVFGTVHNADGGIYTSNTALTAGTGTGGHIGVTADSSTCYRGLMFAVAIYPSALSDANVAAVKASYNAVWTPAAVTKTRTLVYDGDSITEGYGAANQRNRTRLTYAALNNPATAYYNLGVSGISMNTCNNNKIQSLSYQATESPSGKCVVLLAGINDIRSGGATAATVYGYITSYVNYAIGLGYAVGIGTLIRNTTVTAPQEVERVALNTMIRMGAAGLGATLIDYDLDSASITIPDGTHPDNAGYIIMHTRELPIIRTMLGL